MLPSICNIELTQASMVSLSHGLQEERQPLACTISLQGQDSRLQINATPCSLKQESEGWFHFSKGPRLMQGSLLVMGNSRSLVWMSNGGLLPLLRMEKNLCVEWQWPHIVPGVWRTSASWRGGARLILSYWHRNYSKATANRPYYFSFSARKTDLFRENLSFMQQAEVR